LSDDNQRTYREVQAFFRLPSIALVEKDLIVVRAIAALATIDASPFQLVFGGGTALARAHKVVRRMSEDVGHPLIVARKGQKWAVFLHDKPCRNGELYGNHDGRVFRQADRSRSVPLCVPEGQLVSSGRIGNGHRNPGRDAGGLPALAGLYQVLDREDVGGRLSRPGCCRWLIGIPGRAASGSLACGRFGSPGTKRSTIAELR
jgi:hypothetical protein